ncbi:hypothetical protein AB6O49_33395 [Streptomyces sp. SBR177]
MAELVAAHAQRRGGAGRWGACAIGFRLGPGADRRVRLDPPKDGVPWWDAEDEVIVVARGAGPG